MSFHVEDRTLHSSLKRQQRRTVTWTSSFVYISRISSVVRSLFSDFTSNKLLTCCLIYVGFFTLQNTHTRSVCFVSQNAQIWAQTSLFLSLPSLSGYSSFLLSLAVSVEVPHKS